MPDTVGSGLLWKRNRKRKIWVQQWFGIYRSSPRRLCYFKREPTRDAAQLAGEIALCDVHLRLTRDAAIRDEQALLYAFDIVNEQRVYHLAVECKQTMFDWWSFLAPRTLIHDENLALEEAEQRIEVYELDGQQRTLEILARRIASLALLSPQLSRKSATEWPSPPVGVVTLLGGHRRGRSQSFTTSTRSKSASSSTSSSVGVGNRDGDDEDRVAKKHVKFSSNNK
jgi:hypothetical protein